MSRYGRLSYIVMLVVLGTAEVRANDLLWQQPPPVNNNLADGNYFDNTTATANVAPAGTDIVFIGAGGNVTQSGGTFSAQKLRVGNVFGAAAYLGTGTVTVNNGATVSLTLAGGGADASLIIGGGAVATTNSGFSGTLNIDGASSSVTSAQLVQIGFGSQTAATATAIVNITNGGSLVATTGNINLGDRNGATGVGLRGQLNLSGAGSSLTITNTTADLNVGIRGAASSYTQTGGTASIGDAIVVGNNNANASSFSVTGNSILTSKSLTIGETANNVTGVLGGTSVINITTNNLNVGLDDSQNASLTVSDTVDINVQNTATSTGNVFIGRDTSTGAKFTMTGGTIDTGRNFLLGNATNATGIVGTQSGGKITTTLNFVVADTKGALTYNMSGGEILANGQVVVGRQTSTVHSGVMNQTGGTVTAVLGVTVGNAQDVLIVDPTLWGTGIYNVSGGTLTASQTTGTALNIGPQGNGTFRVIGDDAIIDVNGNVSVAASGSTQGTLAYRLEAGDLLSMIDVSGNATFASGAKLDFDTSLASPTQNTYNLLTATDIIDNGIAFTGPSGWNYQIVAGGNGEILQAFLAGVQGDYNNNGFVDAADYILYRKGVTPLPANEVDNVGTTNDQDWVEWKARFGNPTPGGGGEQLSAGQVPEPAALGLVAVGLISLMASRHRSRRNRRM